MTDLNDKEFSLTIETNKRYHDQKFKKRFTFTF